MYSPARLGMLRASHPQPLWDCKSAIRMVPPRIVRKQPPNRWEPKSIEGLTAEGTRRTTTYAVDSIGNDREIVATNENWFSKQLQVEVLTKTSDPRMGDSTTKLDNISLIEPDPALFMPPPDYTIKDAFKSAGGPAAP